MNPIRLPQITPCPYYREEVAVYRSKLQRGDRMRSKPVLESGQWCSHRESPLTRQAAFGIGGAAQPPLVCGGDPTRCPIGRGG